MEEMRRRIAEALAKHAYATVEMDPSPGLGFYFVCECEHRELKDARMGKRDWLAKHQTEMLAPLIRETTADAFLESASVFEHILHAGAPMTAAQVIRSLRTHAAIERADPLENPNAHTD